MISIQQPRLVDNIYTHLSPSIFLGTCAIK